MLTIEELKELPIGEWVWIVDTSEATKENYGGSMYARKYYQSFPDKYFDCGTLGRLYSFNYVDYGTKWLAYKNKEEAEGKSITLPYLLCTSSKFACVIWREDGKVHKTHTFPIDEAKGVLEEKRRIQWKD